MLRQISNFTAFHALISCPGPASYVKRFPAITSLTEFAIVTVTDTNVSSLRSFFIDVNKIVWLTTHLLFTFFVTRMSKLRKLKLSDLRFMHAEA